jgi:GTP-binding protein EngB required for normal cell division
MYDAIVDLLLKVDTAISESVGVVSEADLERMAHIRIQTETRLAHPDEVVFAALAGGTGSGKSSLLNAIAEDEIAHTGGIRPTTSSPLAVVAADNAPAVTSYLRRLDIAIVESALVPPFLCLIDLPDTDSVAVEHRHIVEALLPRVDVVIWVVDPEKYGDAALHNLFLRPLADYQTQFVFVLNQIDRIEERDRSRVMDDFVHVLRDTGVESPVVVATSANPPAGPPTGVDRLLTLLDPTGRQIYPAQAKLLSDLGTLAGELVEFTGGGKAFHFDARWDKSRAGVSLAIASGDVAGGGRQLAEFFESLGRDVGGAIGGTTRTRADDATAIAEEAASVAVSPPEQPSRRRGLRSAKTKGPAEPVDPTPAMLESIEDMLETSVGAPLRETMAKRARANAAVADLYLSVAGLLAAADS